MKKKILSLSFLLLSLSACVSNRVFNDLESRYAELKDNFNRQTKTIESLNEELKDLTEKYVTQEASLQQTEDSLNLKQQKLEQLESSLDLLKLQSESALKERITENEGLLKKIAERENELADRMARVEELEGLIARQKQAMRNLKERLSDALLNFEDKGLTVEARDGKVYVSMENKLLFKSGSWTVEAAGQNAIKSLAGVLAENPDIAILIEGHTDNVPYRGKGPLKGNWDLSTKRATAIVNQLLENPDILPQNLTAAGRGEYLPIAPNSTRSGRAANRRIEVVLSPQLDEISQIINTLD
ncbi:MAG TPA: cell envelope biogenesis protein OmpA [Flavobacteriaceae bacterium]|nr:cell envelope biogenesis protein OmpA [Flavobacteriaceae bacterium]|tara:strand:+ start:7412 stop:8311 length:900 start_codon:yes stop_codon:yes gene_type:complete